MPTIYSLLVFVIIFAACKQNTNTAKQPIPQPATFLTEFSNIYNSPVKKTMYSTFVKDTFSIFQSVPADYNKDSSTKYPLIIILDANAFFEPLLGNIKFSTFIGDIKESVVTGIGYNDFPTMDSLRSRDYTYPVALSEYEMALSGGADKFKDFIDKELLPQIKSQYRIDTQKIVLCGHSLGGYFVLYYLLKSGRENKFSITNFVSASPSLFYDNRYIFGMEDSLSKMQVPIPARLYISMGSRDMDDKETRDILKTFAKQMRTHHYSGLQVLADEYSNFGHIDAALPGFAKGLTFIFTEKKKL